MAYLLVHNEKLTPEITEKLISVCPFSAITFEDGKLQIGAGCKMCKLCVKRSDGIIELVETIQQKVSKDEWRGVMVYADHYRGELHNVTLELLGKAQELAKVTGHPVYALIIGHDVGIAAEKLLKYGADKVFVYDDPKLEYYRIEPYTAAFADVIRKTKPSSVLVGATDTGRTLAPRVAARFRTGITADCTILRMEENTDLIQIRPAFGGNIMAQIFTPDSRPQFCTVRYKIFSAPEPVEDPKGEIVRMAVEPAMLKSGTEILEISEKPREIDISEADIIVAVGRGVKSKADLELVRELADVLNAQMACTRPLVECGWFDAKRQIGLSGRTVKAKLIITVGISGSVQFAAGMRNSEFIVAVNNDPHASIFDIAHLGLVGDLYDILPRLIRMA